MKVAQRYFCIFAIWFTNLCGVRLEALPGLQVSSSGRYLETVDGEPFFYMADTAWALFLRLDREEADRYLADRAEKGFNVIQATALFDLDGANSPNAYGHRPLVDGDPARPLVVTGEENDYWDHVEWVIDRAEDYGLYVAFLPTWGDKWRPVHWSESKVFNKGNAFQYGSWIGRIFKDKSLIWVLGGDRIPTEIGDGQLIHSMARGIRKQVGESALMTFHPRGEYSSSGWFHRSKWLDFNMIQSSHGSFNLANYKMVSSDWERSLVKPTLDAEPRYEAIPVSNNPAKGWFQEWDIRQAAWWAVLAGACGHTYGHNGIWQMWEPGRVKHWHAEVSWGDALSSAGARQMGIMRRFMERHRYHELSPYTDFIVSKNVDGKAWVQASVSGDRRRAILYFPVAESVELDMDVFVGDSVKWQWFDPKTGDYGDVTEGEKRSVMFFESPGKGEKDDRVLLVDSFD